MRYVLSVLIAFASWGTLLAAEASREAERLEKAATILNEIMGTAEKGIPGDLLNKAVCVGVIPSQKKFAIGIGGSGGRGALLCRRGGNGPWGAPSMFTIGGISIGPQLGFQGTDYVLVVMNVKGAQKLLQSKTKLGADASIAGGPVGRTAEGATDLQLHAEILTYSRSRGLFAGLSLSGQVLKQDHDGNERLYGRKVEPKDILFKGVVGVPGAAQPLVGTLTKYSPRGGEKMIEK